MSIIRIMPEVLSNKIAAGEVIERPASVVKELVENAIDAGATSVKIDIERAGTRLIMVTDNGCGMDNDDVLLALEMHGTSKIFNEQDIFCISTLGFRGEAIPSIASISKFTIKSRSKNAIEGSSVVVHGGKFLSASPVGFPQGTCIRVEDLFYNIPARKKFLKSNATEQQHIEETVLNLAIPFPQIAFTLTADGKTIFQSPRSDTYDARLRTIFGKEFRNEMIPVNYQNGALSVTGFIGKPGFTKSTRICQRTFVNDRKVESFAIYRGIRNGYAALEKGRYNPCILFLTLPSDQLDINVHPAKREVRFKQEFVISSEIEKAIKNTLSGNIAPTENVIENYQIFNHGKVSMDSIFNSAEKYYTPVSVPELNLDKTTPAPEDAPKEKKTVYPNRPDDKSLLESLLTDMPDFPMPPQGFDTEKTEEETFEDDEYIQSPLAENSDIPDRIIGILDNSYILCESANHSLKIIDQHAAHERIMFEKLTKRRDSAPISQPLLIPSMLTLPLQYTTLLLNNIKTFEKLGFDIEPMGGKSFMLNAVPHDFPTNGDEELFEEMLSELLENNNTKTTLAAEKIAQAACKAAVKFHDNITVEGAKLLLNQLRRCEQGTLCPHGRPTIIEISSSELIKRFKR